VRSAPFFAIIALGVVAVAKEPPSSRKLSERLMQPDMEKQFNMNQLSPFGRSKSDFQARDANTKSFYIHQKYTPKGYDTKSFTTKTAWDSDFKFSTKAAPTKTYETKAAPTKSAPVKDAREAGKTAATREFAEANRTTVFKGRNQALFDKEGPAAQAKVGAGWGREGQSWSGNLKTLTVDDVREILNKNK